MTPKEALGQFKSDNQEYHDNHHFNFDFERNKKVIEILEKALKDYEVVKREYEILFHENAKEHNEFEKQKQILEVLKKKEVDIAYLTSCLTLGNPREVYNDRYDFVHHKQLTETEFNLIKEWLK